MWWITALSVIIFLFLLVEIDSNTRYKDNEDIE
jgi:hypothetical protein